jgi:hypothetical protein
MDKQLGLVGVLYQFQMTWPSIDEMGAYSNKIIFRIGQDSLVYGPFYMVPVIVSSNLLH